MKEQYLASLADARSKKKSAGSDWLTSYSALDTLLRAGQRGSGTTTKSDDLSVSDTGPKIIGGVLHTYDKSTGKYVSTDTKVNTGQGASQR
jgi:hypothetical protein